jgi:hypothetical protein
LILEGQRQARLHLKFNDPWSHEWAQFNYDDLENLKAHVTAFVTAYNFAKHLKALKWRTPYEVICEAWTKDPSIFKVNPRHLIPGPYT